MDVIAHTQKFQFAEYRRKDEETSSLAYEVCGLPPSESHHNMWTFITWLLHTGRANVPPQAVHSHT
eukprot:5004462-Heterocapsa_arctica.AAC.1